MARYALLLGLFVVPVALLLLGHRLRDRSARQRSAFWGAVFGHSAGMMLGIGALHYPPVLWSSDVRVIIAFWLMLIGGAVGAVIGAVRSGN